MGGVALLLLAIAGLNACSLIHQEQPNETPKLQISTVDTTRIGRNARVQFEVRGSDEDDDPLFYTWNVFGEGVLTDTVCTLDPLAQIDLGRSGPECARIEWFTPSIIDGGNELFPITVTISDLHTESKDLVESFVIEVFQGIPMLSVVADTTVSFTEPFLIFEAVGTDEDGDPLEYIWEQIGVPALDLRPERIDNNLSRLTVVPLFVDTYQLLSTLTDGLDTARTDIRLVITAAAPPDSGTVTLQLDSGRTYEIDVFEYPNRRGEIPLLASSWFEAAQLCAARGKRLCETLEWTKACEGDEIRSYSSVDDPSQLLDFFGRRFCNTQGSEVAGGDFEDLAVSGSFPNCFSSFGVYDMTGNAGEWLQNFNAFGERLGHFTRSNVLVPAPCQGISSDPAALPADFDINSQAAIDSLDFVYQPYTSNANGFRCCRDAN
jgi:hypothetical protein